MDPDVVVVLPVVRNHFPVGLELPFHLGRVPKCANIGIVHEFEEGLHMLTDRRRVAAEIDEHPVMPNGTAHGHQAERVLVQTPRRIAIGCAVEKWCLDQAAVEVVVPRVIGAGEQFQPLARLFEHHHAPVATDIVKGPDLTVPIPHQNDGKTRDHDGHGVAGLRNLRLESGRHPRPAQVLPLLKSKELLTRVRPPPKPPGLRDRAPGRGDGVRADNAGGGVVHGIDSRNVFGRFGSELSRAIIATPRPVMVWSDNRCQREVRRHP